MSAHTPGPWTVRETANYPGRNWREIWSADRKPVAIPDGFTRTRGEEVEEHHGTRISDADARLIAVAPELFAALKAILGLGNPAAGEPGHIDYGTAVVMAATAIAKVYGPESPALTRAEEARNDS